MSSHNDTTAKGAGTLDIEQFKIQPERFLNRELSWLAFNRRVLEEANNLRHPLFERVRFLSICAANMDEFYMVRVAGLRAQIRAGVTSRSIDGMTPEQQLAAVQERAEKLNNNIQSTWRDLCVELAEHHIEILSSEDLKETDKIWLSQHFEEEMLPLLTPTALDPAHPFPFIPNKGLSLVAQLYDTQAQKEFDILIQIPAILGRFVKLPGGKARYLPVEKAIIKNFGQIFPAHVSLKSYATFRVIRDSEIEVGDEAEDLVRTFESALKRRRRGNIVVAGVYHHIDEETLNFLMQKLNISAQQVMRVYGMVGLADCQEIITADDPALLFKPFDPRFPERIRDFGGDCFAAIRQKDFIVHHPYESFDVVVKFLRQAAQDPDVVSIKQTLYRTSKNSPIVEALIEAAESGKSVTALVEIKARFDEAANIRWARDMERAGVQVVYGFMNLKTHAKVSLVVRREGKNLRSYAHLGTGNYHAANARVYTDLSYFTCDKELCLDASRLFNYMTGYATPQNLEKLAISPVNLRQTLTELIDVEIANAKDGKPAQIWAKCNALLDPQIIDKFYEASQAGVEIDLIVRGICTLRPGIPGFSENIRVKSIVGRFLEHGRIYCFANGEEMPSRHAKVFMASADLMARNLDRRIEALVPIENKTVHEQVLDQIMVANLKDQMQSWIMDVDGSYTRKAPAEDGFSAHDYFMTNPSLSGRGSALEDAPMPPRLKWESGKRPAKKPDQKA